MNQTVALNVLDQNGIKSPVLPAPNASFAWKPLNKGHDGKNGKRQKHQKGQTRFLNEHHDRYPDQSQDGNDPLLGPIKDRPFNTLNAFHDS